jgi:hypothetical protein
MQFWSSTHWIRIRTSLNFWIRIRTETNADLQHLDIPMSPDNAGLQGVEEFVHNVGWIF